MEQFHVVSGATRHVTHQHPIVREKRSEVGPVGMLEAEDTQGRLVVIFLEMVLRILKLLLQSGPAEESTETVQSQHVHMSICATRECCLLASLPRASHHLAVLNLVKGIPDLLSQVLAHLSYALAKCSQPVLKVLVLLCLCR